MRLSVAASFFFFFVGGVPLKAGVCFATYRRQKKVKSERKVQRKKKKKSLLITANINSRQHAKWDPSN